MDPRKRFRRIGICILIAGVFLAILAYRWQSSPAPDDTALTKRDSYELQKVGGQWYVITAEIDGWFANLWQRRRLALFLFTLAVAGWAVCICQSSRYSSPGRELE